MNDINNMDFNLYKVFLEVIKCESISKAAKSLYVSQPAISHSIKTLEQQLGCKLFNRTAKGVEPTANALKLLYYVENAYNTIKAGQRIVKESTNLISGEIRIGMPTHVGIFLVSKYIEKFNEIYPGIKFYIVNKSTNEMVRMLENREIDLIVDSYPIQSNRDDITLLELIEVRNCFVGNEKYKDVKNKGTIRIEDLENFPLLLPPKRTSTRQALENAIKDKVDGLDAMINVPTTEVMLELVKKGLGIGYFAENSVAEYISSNILYEIPVNVKLPRTKICLAYVEDFLDNAPKKFCEMLKTEMSNLKIVKEKSLRMILSQECTYNCEMCHKEGVKSKKESLLTADDWVYIYEIANKEYEIRKVNITGGEPFLNKNIEEILRKLKEKNAIITLTTNGYLIDKNINLMKYIDKINISIHSLDKKKYENLCKKEGSFDKVIKNIKLLRNKYPMLNIGINTTIMKGINSSNEDIEELINMAKSLKVELKIIELYPKTSEKYVPISSIEPLLKTLRFKLIEETFRKQKYSDGKQKVTLSKCTCSVVLDKEHKEKECNENNDLYIMPDGKINLCWNTNKEIDILEEVKERYDEDLNKKIKKALEKMGYGCKEG